MDLGEIIRSYFGGAGMPQHAIERPEVKHSGSCPDCQHPRDWHPKPGTASSEAKRGCLNCDCVRDRY